MEVERCCRGKGPCLREGTDGETLSELHNSKSKYLHSLYITSPRLFTESGERGCNMLVHHQFWLLPHAFTSPHRPSHKKLAH